MSVALSEELGKNVKGVVLGKHGWPDFLDGKSHA